jgi:hypothetical protein
MKNINKLKVNSKIELPAILTVWTLSWSLHIHKYESRIAWGIKYISRDYILIKSSEIVLNYE